MAVYTVGSAVDARQRARYQARAARAQYLSSFSDRGIMVRSGVSPRTSVYGRDMKSGVLVDAFTTGDKGQYLHVLVALSGRQSADIEKVYFNEFDAGPIDSDGFIRSGQFVRRKVNTGKHYEALSGVSGGTVTITLPQAADRITSVTYGTPAAETESGTPIPSATLGVITSYTHTPGGNTVTLTGRESITITYEWDDITPLVRVHKFLGAPGQTVPSALVTESGGRRSAAHTGQGITWMWVRLEWDNTVFGQIGMPTIKALVKGNLLWDPRTSTTAWSDNSALCTADYARDTQLGLGCTAAQVPDDELSVEANICDEAVALDDGALGPVRTQRRYTTNGTITAGDSRIANYDVLLDAMAGHAVWVQGRWRIRAGAHPTPEPITITADTLADGAVQIQPRASRRELINAVAATYREPAQLWADAAAPVVVNATYQAQDGGRRITRQVPMPMVQDPMRAQRLAKIILERARQAVTLQVECNWRAYNLLPGQVVPVQLAEYGWTTPKLFEVRRRDLDIARKTVRYLLRETAAGVWDWAYGEATTVDLAPDTELPNPMAAPPALTGLAIASGTAQLLRAADNTLLTRAKLTWDQSTDVFVAQGGTVEIQWQPVNGTQWQSEPPVPGDSTSAYVSPVRDGSMVLFRVRAVNAIGRPSAWLTQVHLVLGQTEPPSDVAGLTSSVAGGVIPWRWTPCPDLDYDVTEVRSADSNWGAASPAPLFRGRVSEWQETVAIAGTYTRYARHFDYGGRPSTNTATRSQVVTAGDLGSGSTAAPVLNLSPPLLVVQADGAGNVVNTATAVSQVTVTEGGADVTTDWVVGKSDGPGILSKVTAGSPPQIEVLTFGSAADTATVLSLDVTQALGALTGPLVDSSYRRLLVQPYTHATLSVPPTIVATGPAADRRSVQFAGSSTQASGLITSASDDYDAAISSVFTFEFWLQAPATTPTWLQYLATVRDSAGTTTGWGLRYDTSNRIALVGATTLTTTALAAGTWHHYAVVKSGSTLTAYLDGTLVGSVTAGGTIGSNKPRLHLGYNPASPASSGFAGALAAIKWRLAAKYTSNFTPAESLTIATADDSLYPLVQLLTYLDGNLTDQKGHSFTQQGITYVTDADGTGAQMNGTGSNSNGIYGTTASRDFDLTGDFCMEAVFKLTAPPTRPRTILNVIDQAFSPNDPYALVLENDGIGGQQMICTYDSGLTTTQSYRSSNLSLNVAYHFAMVRRGNNYYFFLNGVRQLFPVYSTTYRPPSAAYVPNIGNYKPGWSDSLAGIIYWARITNGNCRYDGDFAVPGQPPNSGQGSYIDVSATKLASTITRRLPVSKVPSTVPVVTMSLSPATLTLAADYLGNVTSVVGASSTVTIKVNGVDDSPNWAIVITPSAGVTATLSGRVVSVATFSNAVDTGAIEVVATRSGYQTQSLTLALGKAKSAKPAQTQALDKTVLLIAGETGGKVPSASYTGATVSMTVALGGVDDTANWTFSRTASTGLTTVISANTVTLTNITDTVDSGTIEITASRSGWTTVTLRCTVTKTRLLPPTGVAPPTSMVYALQDLTTGTATASLTMNADGTMVLTDQGGTTTASWYVPTTSAVGAGYWVRASRTSGQVPSAGTMDTWLQLNTARTWSQSRSTIGSRIATMRMTIASDSSGTNVVGFFDVTIQASIDP